MPEVTLVPIRTPADANLILGHAHFIKTAEDLYEAIVNSVPGAKFGIAFSEASGPSLIRREGNDEALTAAGAVPSGTESAPSATTLTAVFQDVRLVRNRRLSPDRS